MTLPRLLLVLPLLLGLATPAGGQTRIKDIADTEGVRANQLVGYGLVVGLNGTGDKIDSAVFIEAGVLNGHQSLLQESGNAVDGDPVTFLRQDPTNIPPLLINDSDGGDADWLGGIAREIILSRRRDDQA